MNNRWRKRIRLDQSAYATGGTVWFCTIGTCNRYPLLSEPDLAEFVVQTLVDRSARSGIDLLLYCVMPDHIHLVVAVHTGDLISYVGAVKSIVAVARLRTGDRRRLWQRSVHDSGIRTTENMDELTEYVFTNPVTAGLVDDWNDWPWIGGSLLEPA